MFNEHVQKPPERLLALIGEINVGNLQRLGYEPHQSVAAGTSSGKWSGCPTSRSGRSCRASRSSMEYLPHEIIL
jgi:hypothetical protein